MAKAMSRYGNAAPEDVARTMILKRQDVLARAKTQQRKKQTVNGKRRPLNGEDMSSTNSNS